ncbi:hypothetical protein LCGC14_0405180 [marine sediment metagenome]|uniref:Uncharacterized protein n=1 Tax=marine sediment metagenome TaxID=412755 RepID=A0A0F9T143_9ZZZZ
MNIYKSIPILLTIFLVSCSGIIRSIDTNLSRSYNLTSSQVAFTQPTFPYEPGQYRFDTVITKIVFGGDQSTDYIEFYVHNHHLMNEIRILVGDNISIGPYHEFLVEVNGTYRMYMGNQTVNDKNEFAMNVNRDVLGKNIGSVVRLIVDGIQTQEYFLDNFY